jgi:hypothetical protein
MECHFCHGPAQPSDALVFEHDIGRPWYDLDGAPRCCTTCLTSERAVCCVICECLTPRRDAIERPDLGESPMGGCWLCHACAAEDPEDATAEPAAGP